ncbi:MAG: 2-C-methyl-D-erythritol 2,4-cyclodiphosphate synthase [Oligoflexia bacterium]|nr:2-C-methyl-D-erythritol 2,4-cyclodiphosphate synthase [Oligoflexia bacterium]
MTSKLRIGQGIDVHAFVAGRKLILGGVEIPAEFGLEGHSDADALLHALIDAILGAAGLPDIGHFFPDTEARWKGAASTDLLARVWKEVSARGWRLVNADICILAQKPKLSPFISEMKQSIAAILNADVGAIGVKATTTEKLGFVGRAEGLCASAVVLLES